MGQNLKVGLTGGGGYENRRPPVAKTQSDFEGSALYYSLGRKQNDGKMLVLQR